VELPASLYVTTCRVKYTFVLKAAQRPTISGSVLSLALVGLGIVPAPENKLDANPWFPRLFHGDRVNAPGQYI
jgi:hypothetical protein